MRCTVDVGELAVVLELDAEPDGIDLTRDGLGDACLDAAVEGMLASHRAQCAPDGAPWAPLKAATVRRKGHATIGVWSGIFLDPHRWRMAPRTITPRVAVWFYPTTRPTGDGCDGHARAFHAGLPLTGSPARPILGGTPAASESCHRLMSGPQPGEAVTRCHLFVIREATGVCVDGAARHPGTRTFPSLSISGKFPCRALDHVGFHYAPTYGGRMPKKRGHPCKIRFDQRTGSPDTGQKSPNR